jgi:hypothetical protein
LWQHGCYRSDPRHRVAHLGVRYARRHEGKSYDPGFPELRARVGVRVNSRYALLRGGIRRRVTMLMRGFYRGENLARGQEAVSLSV